MGKEASSFLSSFFAWMNENVKYAVLRNYELLPDTYHSRDIDLAICKKDYIDICIPLLKFIEKQNWKLVVLHKSYRLNTWVCAHLSDEGVCNIIQLDFFFNTSVYGLNLLSSGEIINKRCFNGKVYYADRACEFLDKYMYNRCVGAAYPEKYSAVRKDAEDCEFVKKAIEQVLGCISLDECDAVPKGRLLKNVIKYNFKHHFFRTIASLLTFEFCRVRNYIVSTGFTVGFSGPDGVGKTTVIDCFMDNMGPVFQKIHQYFHFRPALLSNIGEVAHKVGVKRDVDRNFSEPHRGGKTGSVNSFLRLMYYSFDYIVGYFVKVKPVIRGNGIAVFDRYYTDIICDSHRSRIFLNYKFLYWFGRLFIPSLDYNFLLTASPETILNRKNELDRRSVEDINAKIEYLSGKKGYYKIYNETSPEDAVKKILNIILDKQHRRNIGRISRR